MHIQLLVAQRHDKVSAKTGKPYSFVELQGIIHQDDGRQDVFVYDYFGKRDEALPDLKPGRYDVVTELQPDYKTRKLEARITKLVPHPVVAEVKPARAS